MAAKDIPHAHPIVLHVAVDTSGALESTATMNFIKELARRLTQATGEEEATTCLLPRLSVSVQLPQLWEHSVLSHIYVS